jgi:two-component sensor histidine kinase
MYQPHVRSRWESAAPIAIGLLGAGMGELLVRRTEVEAGLPELSPSIPVVLLRLTAWAATSVPFVLLTRRVLTSGWSRVRSAAILGAAVVAMIVVHVALVRLTVLAWPGIVSAAPAGALANLRPLLRGDAVVAVLIALTIYALEHARVARLARDRERDLEALATRAQLEMLRMQLNPHFLFNSLNAISSLIDGEARTAQRMIDRLGGFLRMTLTMGASAEVPLRDELFLVKQYLEIEGIRFGPRLRTHFEVDAGVEDALIPALLLQPLVENAVRHGIQPSIPGGTVSVLVTKQDSRLQVDVMDDGVGMKQPMPNVTGLGMRNTAERLRHAYGLDASVTLSPRAGGGTLARVLLPLRRPTTVGRA